MAEVRIRVPKTVKQGETITVRALVPHPMEVIQRDKDGKVVEFMGPSSAQRHQHGEEADKEVEAAIAAAA